VFRNCHLSKPTLMTQWRKRLPLYLKAARESDGRGIFQWCCWNYLFMTTLLIVFGQDREYPENFIAKPAKFMAAMIWRAVFGSGQHDLVLNLTRTIKFHEHTAKPGINVIGVLGRCGGT